MVVSFLDNYWSLLISLPSLLSHVGMGVPGKVYELPFSPESHNWQEASHQSKRLGNQKQLFINNGYFVLPLNIVFYDSINFSPDWSSNKFYSCEMATQIFLTFLHCFYAKQNDMFSFLVDIAA